MRSRYFAYTKANMGYIQATMAPPASNGFSPDTTKVWASGVKWLGLDILEVSGGQPGDSEGMVHFQAHYRENITQKAIDERSLFRRIDGRWFYVDAL